MNFPLEAGGEKRLEISWKLFYKDLTILLDGVTVGVIPDQKALIEGREFRLLDGTTLKVQLVRKFNVMELQVLRNGVPLPSSAADPETKVQTAAGVLYFIAGLNCILGLISFLFDLQILQIMGVNLGSILYGLFF